MAAASLLSKNKNFDITIIDKGKDVDQRKCFVNVGEKCRKCSICSNVCGAGGAGTYSSGLLNLSGEIGGNLTKITQSEKETQKLINMVDKFFSSPNIDIKRYKPDDKFVKNLTKECSKNNIKYINAPQKQIGTENSPEIISNIINNLKKNSVKFLFRKKVLTIKNDHIILKDNKKISFDYLIAAPGRNGNMWLAKNLEKLDIQILDQPISLGVRVEVEKEITDPICRMQHDPKFLIKFKNHSPVRTFCTNPEGFVIMERYSKNIFSTNGVGYHSKRSKNTNFALLVRLNLVHPSVGTTEYGDMVVDLFDFVSGGEPTLQRLGDLKNEKRSTEEKINLNKVIPTLGDYNLGDIGIAYPYKILKKILNAIERLDKIMPGIDKDSTLIYAPEIKYSAKRVKTNNKLQTSLDNIFVAGDGAGLTRGIVTAAATGFIVAKSILEIKNN